MFLIKFVSRGWIKSMNNKVYLRCILLYIPPCDILFHANTFDGSVFMTAGVEKKGVYMFCM